MGFWALPAVLLLLCGAGVLFAAIKQHGTSFYAGIGCAVAAVVATFLHVTHGYGPSAAAWLALLLGDAGAALILIAAWRRSLVQAVVGAMLVLTTLLLVLTAVGGDAETLPLDPHPDAAQRILALGDSYIAGEGSPPYFDGTDRPTENTCHRSAAAYPYLLADELGTSLRFLSCSGARTQHVLRIGQAPKAGAIGSRAQLDELRDAGKADVVLLSIGGNDAGFAEIGVSCAVPGQPDCRRSSGFWLHRLEDDVYPKLVDTYTQVREAAGGAPVFVMTYPNPLGPRYCGDVQLTRGEWRFVREVFVKRLNEIVRLAARAAQVRVIPLDDALAGRRFCEVPLARTAVNFIALGRTRGPNVALSLKALAQGTLHPNAVGHQLLAAAVRPVVGAALAGRLEPLAPVPEPGAKPEPNVPAEDARPLSPEPFPQGTACAGDEVSLITPMTVRPGIERIDLTDLAPDSMVCFRGGDDVWRTVTASATGTAQVQVDVGSRAAGAINDVLAQRAGGVWVRVAVSRLEEGTNTRPGPEVSGLVYVALLALLLFTVGFAIHLLQRRRG